MSHLNKAENKSDANYTAVEMAVIGDQKAAESQPSSENRFRLFRAPLSVIRRDWAQNGNIKLFILALGIFIAYFIVGILQETVMRGKYKTDDGQCEKFKYAACLVFVQFIFSFTFIKVLDFVKPDGKDETHPAYYACAAMANVCAMVSSYSALRWVTFPMQVILKSAKPISVMIGGLFFCKRYTIQRYLFVLIIVIGVVMFKLFEKKEGKKAKTDDCKVENSEAPPFGIDIDNTQLIGIGLLVFSLAMDGLLGGVQDKIRDRYAPTSRQLMIGMTIWGVIILLVYTVATGEIFDVYKFATRHPIILLHLTLYASTGVVGQLFIFTMVSSFGSLPCSITTTVRKFFSVLFSIVFFANPSTPLQWLGAVLVFAGLLCDAIFGKKNSSSNSNENAAADGDAETTEKLTESPEEKIEITKASTNKPDGQNIV